MSLSLGRSKNLANSDKATTFTKNAPVQTNTNSAAVQAPEEQTKTTDPEVVAAEEQPEQEQVKEDQYPWRKHHHDVPLDVLWGEKDKKTIEIPRELALRLAWLKGETKPERYGERVTETSILVKALDDYTTRELKKKGYKVK